jgi:hypothetical protein
MNTSSESYTHSEIQRQSEPRPGIFETHVNVPLRRSERKSARALLSRRKSFPAPASWPDVSDQLSRCE